jgi:hypothetical protein
LYDNWRNRLLCTTRNSKLFYIAVWPDKSALLKGVCAGFIMWADLFETATTSNNSNNNNVTLF